MADTLHRVKVTIHNQDYYLKGNLEPVQMQKLAATIDENMNKIMQKNQCGSLQAAVLCALQLAEELNQLQIDYNALVNEVENLS